jgi:hypothetical protein
MNKFLIPLAAACLAGAASADTPNFVDAQGNGFPVTVITLPVQGPSYTQDMWISPSPDVYAALDSTIPSGIYYFQLLDLDFNNLSELALGDRMFEVVNNAGALTVTRMGGTPDLPAPGAGAGGVGPSIPLFPFVSAPYYPNRPELLCAHKAIIFELLPDGSNRIVRSGFFRVGDGQLASISGIVFNDLDRDGARDAGEQGIAGRTVKLISNNPATAGQVVATKTTGAAATPGTAASCSKSTPRSIWRRLRWTCAWATAAAARRSSTSERCRWPASAKAARRASGATTTASRRSTPVSGGMSCATSSS